MRTASEGLDFERAAQLRDQARAIDQSLERQDVVMNGLQDLAAVKVPVIVAISVQEGNHFVVVRGIVGNEIYLADPTRGNTRMPLDVFAKHWVHNAVLAVLHKDMDLSPASRLTIPYAEIDPQYPNRPYVRRMMNPFLP